jgi:hypothetical protein
MLLFRTDVTKQTVEVRPQNILKVGVQMQIFHLVVARSPTECRWFWEVIIHAKIVFAALVLQDMCLSMWDYNETQTCEFGVKFYHFLWRSLHQDWLIDWLSHGFIAPRPLYTGSLCPTLE